MAENPDGDTQQREGSGHDGHTGSDRQQWDSATVGPLTREGGCDKFWRDWALEELTSH